jgi:hypothetical protein
VAQRCVVCTAAVAVRQLHSWPRPGAFWALLLEHLKSCENPTSSAAGSVAGAVHGRSGRPTASEGGCRMPPQRAAAALRVDHLAATLRSSGGEGTLWLSAAVVASSTDVS